MITVSNEYKNQLNKLSLSPKSKIVVDGVEYLGNVLKTFPKIKHQATSLIGCFPTKTVDFEIYNFNNDIDFLNREIEVYLGLYFNNQIEWIKQGVFIPREENIETNITTRTIIFKNVQDKTQLLNIKYESNLDWNIKRTGLEIIEEICNEFNIQLANNNFPFNSYLFSQPNFNENITYRSLIASLAEIGGAIAIFNNDGKLEIKKQTETNYIVERSRYSKISEEKEKIINTVILGKDGIKDDIVYPMDLTENREEYKILDNGFVDLIRSEIIEEVANNIIGFNYQPITLENFTDGFIFELNDVIKVKDKNNNKVRLVILDIERNSRIKSTIKCISQEATKTDYNIAGSIKERIKTAELKVDHANKKIESTISEIVELDGKNQENFSKIIQDIDNIKSSIQKIGGNNLLKNSVMFLNEGNNIDFWDVKVGEGEPLVDLSKPTFKYKVQNFSFENDELIIESKIDKYPNVSYDITELVKNNEGKSLWFNFESINRTGYGTPIQLKIQFLDTSFIFYKPLSNDNFSEKYSYLIENTKNIKKVDLLLMANNSNNPVQSNFTIIKPSLNFKLNAQYKNPTDSYIKISADISSLNFGALSGNSFILNDKAVVQKVIVDINSSYSFSTKVKKFVASTGWVKIYNDYEEYIINFLENDKYFYRDFFIENLKPKTNFYYIEFYADKNITFTDNMFSIGAKRPWEQASGEVMNLTMQVSSNGLKIYRNDLKDYTLISPLEFAGYTEVNGKKEKTFTTNKDTFMMKKAEIQEEIKLSPIKIVPKKSGEVKGWAFVEVEK